MRFTSTFLTLAAIVVGATAEKPSAHDVLTAEQKAIFADGGLSSANLSPAQEATLVDLLRGSWSNQTLAIDAKIHAAGSKSARGSSMEKRCQSCSGNLDYAICVSSKLIIMLECEKRS